MVMSISISGLMSKAIYMYRCKSRFILPGGGGRLGEYGMGGQQGGVLFH